MLRSGGLSPLLLRGVSSAGSTPVWPPASSAGSGLLPGAGFEAASAASVNTMHTHLKGKKGTDMRDPETRKRGYWLLRFWRPKDGKVKFAHDTSGGRSTRIRDWHTV